MKSFKMGSTIGRKAQLIRVKSAHTYCRLVDRGKASFTSQGVTDLRDLGGLNKIRD